MIKKLKNTLGSIKGFFKRRSNKEKVLNFLRKSRRKYPHIIFKLTTDLFEENIDILGEESEFIKKYDYCIEKYSMYFDNNFIKLQGKEIETRDKRQDREHLIEKFFIYQVEIINKLPFFFEKIKLTPDYHDTREGVRKKLKQGIVKPASAVAIFFVTIYIISISTGDWSGIKAERKDILIYLENHWQDLFRNGGAEFYLKLILILFITLAIGYGIILGTYKGIVKPLKNFFFHDRVKIKHIEFEKNFDVICRNRGYASRLFNDSLAGSMLKLHKEGIEYITFHKNKIYLKLKMEKAPKGLSLEEKEKTMEEETMRKMSVAHKIARTFDKEFMDNLKGRF